MTHLLEDDLIAYHLEESPQPGAIREHLERCAECAAASESIAETLRVFSADAVPRPNLDQAWQRLRGSLPAPPVAKRRGPGLPRWRWMAPAAAVAAILLLSLGLHLRREAVPARPDLAFHRPGPLTAQPADPAIANHLESAERLLTEVNHASGELNGATRAEAHDLRLHNAVYVHKAHEQGDLAEASVLENLGRVLTTLDHEPPASDRGWHIRFEMNTDGLLLEIRILRQNDIGQ